MPESGKLNILIETGTDFVLPFTVYDNNGNPLDLTGATVESQMREYAEAYDFFEFSCMHNGVGGRITITMPHETTTQIPFTHGVYDVKVTMADGTISHPLSGEVYIKEGVTKSFDGSVLIMLGIESFEDLPEVGNVDRLYFDYSDRRIYRWNGLNYVSATEAISVEGDHDPTRAYQYLSIVSSGGVSYIAKKLVPTGIAITDTDYWMQISPNPFAVGTVTTVPASESARISVSGTFENPLLDFWIPRGAAGNEAIDDTKGRGYSDFVWSADRLGKLQYYVTPELFGAVGDGTTDDTQAWLDAIASGQRIIAENSYVVTQQLILDNDVICNGVIYNSVSNGVKIQGKGTGKYYKLNVRAKTQTTSQYTGIEIVNCTGCSFDLNVKNFYNGVVIIGDGAGAAYNHFNRVHIVNAKYFVTLLAQNSGWCNENYFYNGRALGESGSRYKGADYGITLTNNSNHGLNANHFMNFCLEGSYCGIVIDSECRDNNFTYIRNEGCTYLANLDKNANLNNIGVTYGSIANVVNNNGYNCIFSHGNEYSSGLSQLIYSVDLHNNTANNATYLSAPNLYRALYLNDSLSFYNLAGMQSLADGIAVGTTGSIFGAVVDVSIDKTVKMIVKTNNLYGYRPFVIPLDATDKFITGIKDDIKLALSGGAYEYSNTNGKYYTTGANNGQNENVISFPDAVKKAFVGINIMGTSTTLVVSGMQIYGTKNIKLLHTKPTATLNSIPTSTGYYMGQTVYSTANPVKWVWNGTTWSEVSL